MYSSFKKIVKSASTPEKASKKVYRRESDLSLRGETNEVISSTNIILVKT